MRILVSGFEPFGGLSTNPTLELINKAKNFEIEGVDIDTIQLPVVYRECTPPLLEKINEWQPDIVICLGVAVGCSSINLERVGINVEDTVGEGRNGDNNGDRPVDRPIVNNGPEGLFSTLPIRLLLEKLQESKIPSMISNTAGTYICNTTLYTVLHKIQEESLDIKAGFIHVPATPEMISASPEVPSMGMDTQTRALKIIIENLRGI
ncbi:pyroglutamyl-peptidase I [Salipaludibacillus daqingensis]|uniref:pyroglutamyl-peptidase I n=1 Tax=Salipaludibacillus daqingensis TaxID=3041001 RepID=UPI002476C4F2|nr:pyroglutamyl-peptidase I [Salipaludibacillus daqingensis]